MTDRSRFDCIEGCESTCTDRLAAKPLKVTSSDREGYLSAVGVPGHDHSTPVSLWEGVFYLL